MVFDPLVTNPGRLRILTALAAEPMQEFVRLRDVTQLTDGNLSTHARRLARAGLLAIDKSFRGGRPLTTLTLTPQGRRALETHVQRVSAVLQPSPRASRFSGSSEQSEDWVD